VSKIELVLRKIVISRVSDFERHLNGWHSFSGPFGTFSTATMTSNKPSRSLYWFLLAACIFTTCVSLLLPRSMPRATLSKRPMHMIRKTPLSNGLSRSTIKLACRDENEEDGTSLLSRLKLGTAPFLATAALFGNAQPAQAGFFSRSAPKPPVLDPKAVAAAAKGSSKWSFKWNMNWNAGENNKKVAAAITEGAKKATKAASKTAAKATVKTIVKPITTAATKTATNIATKTAAKATRTAAKSVAKAITQNAKTALPQASPVIDPVQAKLSAAKLMQQAERRMLVTKVGLAAAGMYLFYRFGVQEFFRVRELERARVWVQALPDVDYYQGAFFIFVVYCVCMCECVCMCV